MLHTITFLEKHRCFNEGDTFAFRSGVNLLVGDQGCGKSTLLEAINSKAKVKVVADLGKSAFLDFEKGLPRNKSDFLPNVDYLAQVAAGWSSHGQVVNAALRGMPVEYGLVVLLDEPDAALSVRSCVALVHQLNATVARGCQIIAAVHNPILIASQEAVLSLEHRRWMPGRAFLQTQGYTTC